MKMQQQSMSLAGINLDLTSSVTLSAAAVKSESASNPDSLHPPLASTLSNSSIAERNVPSQQVCILVVLVLKGIGQAPDQGFRCLNRLKRLLITSAKLNLHFTFEYLLPSRVLHLFLFIYFLRQ